MPKARAAWSRLAAVAPAGSRTPDGRSSRPRPERPVDGGLQRPLPHAQPGKQGAHERFHRTLKAETTQPVAADATGMVRAPREAPRTASDASISGVIVPG